MASEESEEAAPRTRATAPPELSPDQIAAFREDERHAARQTHLSPAYVHRVLALYEQPAEKVIDDARQALSFGNAADVKVAAYALLHHLERAPGLHLERAARACMAKARDTSNVWVALVIQDCAIRIRKLPGWVGWPYPQGQRGSNDPQE